MNPESLAKPVAEYIMTRTDAIKDNTQDIKNPKTYGLDALRRTLNMPKTPDIMTTVPAHMPDAVSPYEAFTYRADAPVARSPQPETIFALDKTHVSLKQKIKTQYVKYRYRFDFSIINCLSFDRI